MIHVAIDARLPDQGQGGVQQVIRSLAEGFHIIEKSEIKRSWIVLQGTKWWDGIFPPEDSLILVRPPFGKISLWISNRSPKLVSFLYPVFNKIKSRKAPFDQRLRKLHVDIVHFPFQDGFTTEFPFVYHPHDLQHEYFPEYFNKSQIQHRNTTWRKLAIRSEAVIAASPLVAKDLIDFWNITPTKISIIPIPPPTRNLDARSINPFRKLTYIVYPAVFWPHKNHEIIIRAMKLIPAEPQLHCVFTGSDGPKKRYLQRLVSELGLNSRVHFTGHTSEDQYGHLINDSIGVVIPSLFEAMSLTVADAQNFSKDIICSDLPFFKLHPPKGLVFFDPRCETSLCQKLELLVERHRNGVTNSSGYDSASQQLNLRVFIEQIQSIYISLSSSQSP
jgi:glycosyltransferase involved in cell wall biosynthesis